MQTYLLHGLILFSLGTLLGIPHGLSKGRKAASVTELWRVAHLSTCVGGVSLIALTFSMERIFPGKEYIVMIPFSLAAYLSFIACTASGIIGKGWDSDKSSPSILIVYWLRVIASISSVIAVLGFLFLLAEKIRE